MKRRSGTVVVAVALVAVVTASTRPATADTDGRGATGEVEMASADLADLSLEELMNVEVYSAAKKKQKLGDSPSAAYILTQADIKRSGAMSIPEALRLVPGVEVAHIDSNKWAITIRGFNDRFANKLLVLIDGRTVYTPLFAGVYWDVQDTMIEDIDRIEVIRGPGGTVWGANAVNGVINIITKSSEDTQGTLASYGMGDELDYNAALRFGGKLGEAGHYRIYGKWFQRDDFETAAGTNGGDGWRQGRAGFRSDWEMGDDDTFMASGEIYDGTSDSRAVTATLDPATAPAYETIELERTDVAGGHLLARWTHRFSETSETEVQTYYDRTTRSSGGFREDRDTVDIEFTHRVGLWSWNDLVWGLGYRVTRDDLLNDGLDGAALVDPGSFVDDPYSIGRFSWSPTERDMQTFNGFVQDEISLFDDRLLVTLGTKVEHNDSTGWEVQPSLRALFKLAERHSVWAAVSRSVRTPSRSEDDISINADVFAPGEPPFTPPARTVGAFSGTRSFKSEDLVAYELGYRAQLHDTVSLDVAGYYNDYDDLRSLSVDPALGVGTDGDGNPFLVATGIATNFMHGETFGVEVALDWSPTEFALLRSGYTYMDIDLSYNQGAEVPFRDPLSILAEGQSPHNQVFAHGFFDLPHDVDLDLVVRYVDRLESIDIDSYITLDVRAAWEPVDGLELAFVGRNLTEDSHPEFASSTLVGSVPTEVQRSFFGMLTYRH